MTGRPRDRADGDGSPSGGRRRHGDDEGRSLDDGGRASPIAAQDGPSRTTVGGPPDAEVEAEGENSFTFDFPKVDAFQGAKSKAR